jgi:phosphohistidine phosphatase SixA
MSRGAAVLFAAALCLLLTACASDSGGGVLPDEVGIGDEQLLRDLRAGGLTLLIRHAETKGPGVDPLETLGDCAAQRELSDAGRQDAREMGAAIEDLGIPVGAVRASPFCRTIESAELAFGSAVEDESLLSLASVPDMDEEEAARAAAARYAEVPAAGTVTVLVGQRSNIQRVTGAAPEEGATVVLAPDGESFEVLASLPPGIWQELAAAYAD